MVRKACSDLWCRRYAYGEQQGDLDYRMKACEQQRASINEYVEAYNDTVSVKAKAPTGIYVPLPAAPKPAARAVAVNDLVHYTNLPVAGIAVPRPI